MGSEFITTAQDVIDRVEAIQSRQLKRLTALDALVAKIRKKSANVMESLKQYDRESFERDVFQVQTVIQANRFLSSEVRASTIAALIRLKYELLSTALPTQKTKVEGPVTITSEDTVAYAFNPTSPLDSDGEPYLFTIAEALVKRFSCEKDGTIIKRSFAIALKIIPSDDRRLPSTMSEPHVLHVCKPAPTHIVHSNRRRAYDFRHKKMFTTIVEELPADDPADVWIVFTDDCNGQDVVPGHPFDFIAQSLTQAAPTELYAYISQSRLYKGSGRVVSTVNDGGHKKR